MEPGWPRVPPTYRISTRVMIRDKTPPSPAVCAFISLSFCTSSLFLGLQFGTDQVHESTRPSTDPSSVDDGVSCLFSGSRDETDTPPSSLPGARPVSETRRQVNLTKRKTRRFGVSQVGVASPHLATTQSIHYRAVDNVDFQQSPPVVNSAPAGRRSPFVHKSSGKHRAHHHFWYQSCPRMPAAIR